MEHLHVDTPYQTHRWDFVVNRPYVWKSYEYCFPIAFPYDRWPQLFSHAFSIAWNLAKLLPISIPYHHPTFPYHFHIWVRYGPTFSIPFPYFFFGKGSNDCFPPTWLGFDILTSHHMWIESIGFLLCPLYSFHIDQSKLLDTHRLIVPTLLNLFGASQGINARQWENLNLSFSYWLYCRWPKISRQRKQTKLQGAARRFLSRKNWAELWADRSAQDFKKN